jgi:hypothetical protein
MLLEQAVSVWIFPVLISGHLSTKKTLRIIDRLAEEARTLLDINSVIRFLTALWRTIKLVVVAKSPKGQLIELQRRIQNCRIKYI